MHDHHGFAIGCKPRQPTCQHFVQCGLADADRGVAPDRCKPNCGRHVVGCAHIHVSDAVQFGVSATKFSGSLVDIDRPHGCVGRAACHRECYCAGTAAEIE